MNAQVRRWTSSWGSSRTGQQVGSGGGGGTGIRSMRCLILAGKWWCKQCKAIKDPQAPSKVSGFALSKQIDGLLLVQALYYPAPVREGPWSSCVECGIGMFELLCSWLLCWLLPGKWRESGHPSPSLSYLLPVLSKEQAWGAGAVPSHADAQHNGVWSQRGLGVLLEYCYCCSIIINDMVVKCCWLSVRDNI